MAQRRKALEEIEYFTGALLAQLKLLQAAVASLPPRTRRKIRATFEAQAMGVMEDLMKEKAPTTWGMGFAETGELIVEFFDAIEGKPPTKH